MKIEKVEVNKIAIPMVTSFRISSWNITEKPTLIIKITTDNGIIAYGETSGFSYPFYKMETIDISLLALCKYVIPLVLHKEFKNTEELVELLQQIKGCNFAKTGIENAFIAARAIEKNVSLKRLIGGIKDKIPVGESIGIKDTIQETLEEVSLRLEQGFQRIKVKIKPGWDIQIIESIREEFGNIPLMVDANSAYTLDHMDILEAFDAYDLMMIEQPLADDDIVDHSILQKKIKTPICLDESILSRHDARRAVYLDSCRVINIKPVRVGGVWEGHRIHDYGAMNNIGVWCGGMGETTLGRAFNIALASLPHYIYPADMSPPSFLFTDDITTETFTVDKKGYIDVPDVPGIGFTVDEKKVKKYTVEKFEFI